MKNVPTIEEILTIEIITFVILLLVMLIEPTLVIPNFQSLEGDFTLIETIERYFDMAVRGGSFSILWFVFLPSLSYYIVKRRSMRLRTFAVLLGFMISIYLYLPYEQKTVVIGSPSPLVDFEPEYRLYYEPNTLFELNYTSDCGDKIEFFWYPSCGAALSLENSIESVEKDFDLEFERKCLSKECNMTEETLDGYAEDASHYSIFSIPSLVFRCKYVVWGTLVEEEYNDSSTFLKSILCTLYDLPEDKCSSFTEVPIVKQS